MCTVYIYIYSFVITDYVYYIHMQLDIHFSTTYI